MEVKEIKNEVLNPETDFEQYKKMYEKVREIEDKIHELEKQKQEVLNGVNKYLEQKRDSVNDDLIKKASEEYQKYLLEKINTVLAQGNVEEQSKYVNRLNTHIASKLKRIEVDQTQETKEIKELEERMEEKDIESPVEEEEETINPKVKSILKRIAKAKDKISEIKIAHFDKEGNEIERLITDANGKVLKKYKIEYDYERNIKREIQLDRTGTPLHEIEFQLDEKGNPLKEVMKHARTKKIMSQCVYEYTGDKLIKKIWYDTKGKKTRSWNYEYNGGSYPKKVIWKDDEDNPYGICEYEYDNNGRLTKEISKRIQGDVLKDITYEYEETK